MDERPPTPASRAGRSRAAIALGAALLLAVIVAVAALTSGTDPATSPEDCLAAWNEDEVALADGVHAYRAHDYRATLIGRVDDQGDLLGAEAEEGRCAVVFAADQVDFEPDFGVRVHALGRWSGLVATDGVPIEAITAMQRRASAEANATLLPDGSLEPQ